MNYVSSSEPFFLLIYFYGRSSLLERFDDIGDQHVARKDSFRKGSNITLTLSPVIVDFVEVPTNYDTAQKYKEYKNKSKRRIW